MVGLQFFVKLQVLLDQVATMIERESDLLQAHSQLPTVTHAVKISEIAIDSRQAVMSFARDLISSFAFRMFTANDRFVGQAAAEVVQGSASGDQLLLLAFMGRQHCRELTITAIEQ